MKLIDIVTSIFITFGGFTIDRWMIRIDHTLLWIEGDMITSDKERFAIGDDLPENLFVSSDADEDALLGSKTEGLIL